MSTETKQLLTDNDLANIQGTTYLALVKEGYNGGVGESQWDKAYGRAIEAAILSRLQEKNPPVATVKENPYCPEGTSDELTDYLPVGMKLFAFPPIAPTQPVGDEVLREAALDVLEKAPCECPHKLRYETGEHFSGCHLFDLNKALAGKQPRFLNVSCSQCGKEFGPGNAGYSHCQDHPSLTGNAATSTVSEPLFALPPIAPVLPEPVNPPIAPDICPITKRRFWGNISHPERGLVATYGGPYDTYTIPEVCEDGELRSERYDQDAGAWTEGGEPIGWFYEEQPDLPSGATHPVAAPTTEPPSPTSSKVVEALRQIAEGRVMTPQLIGEQAEYTHADTVIAYQKLARAALESEEAPKEPMSDADVLAIEVLQYNFGLNGGAGPVSKKGWKIIRAIEAHHGIGSAAGINTRAQEGKQHG